MKYFVPKYHDGSYIYFDRVKITSNFRLNSSSLFIFYFDKHVSEKGCKGYFRYDGPRIKYIIIFRGPEGGGTNFRGFRYVIFDDFVGIFVSAGIPKEPGIHSVHTHDNGG